jgi:protein involved in polysaccharide export with SLBB domain
VNAQEEAALVSTSRQVPFRNSQLEIQDVATPEGNSLSSRDAASDQGDSEDLSEKLQAAQNETRFAQSKLESSRKALAAQTGSKNFEKADLAQMAVKDWEARVKASQSKVAQIQREMQLSSNSAADADSAEGNVILPGENVEIFVVEDTSFNSRYQVRRGGYIILPSVGRISIAGKTLSGAEKAIRETLEASQLRHATVMVEKAEGGDVESGPVVFLSGEFKRPRPFHIPAGTKPTLVGCILSAGGVTDKADLTRVKVMRMAANKGVVEEVNVEKILQGGGLASDLTLEEGDVVTIPGGAPNVIFLTGNVKSQGSFLLKPGDKIGGYAAILQHGGFARFANEKAAYILRAAPDGTKIKLPLNVSAIKKGQAADIPLQGNDIIVVPEKFFSF